MSKRVMYLWCCLWVLVAAGLAQGELVGHWKLDEGGGSKITDSSGKGNDGSVTAGTPTWIAGVQGTALLFHGLGVSGGGGDTITVPYNANLDISGSLSMALWIRPEADDPEGKGTTTAPMARALSTASPSWSFQVRYGWGGAPSPNMAFTFNTTPRAWAFVGKKLTRYEWCHIACSYDGTTLKCFLNGAQTDSTAMGAITKSPTPVLIGSDGWGCDWIGAIDDVRMYNNALTLDEIKTVMSGPAKLAGSPKPGDKAVDVPRDTSLSWMAGQFAVTHDVYLGKAFADVNTATAANKNLLVSQGQKETSYRPAALLDFGQTYYWRVDEVNKPADNVTFKGNVWSFTVEPYGYPIKPVAATASSFQAGMGPEKTIDGSGMTGDLHGVDGTTMWLSTGAPNWIQYEFDKVYKLADLKVWNYNALIEGFMGFGAKQVKIETSTDGTTWKALANVPEFAKGTSLPGYAANTTVNFGGVDAKFVKLTIEKNWGGLAPQAGLSEVRFSAAPMQAFGPQPATAATGIAVEGVTLNWRPGRAAVSHKVLFGTDQAAVAAGTAPAKTVTEHSFDPGSLNLGTTYYWKVDEVNAAATYPGEVWSFTTEPYRLVDDFESYSDKAGNEIWSFWIDGFADNYKSSGSTVGLDTAKNGTFGETTIIHGGKQSMPLFYDNTKGPGFSEAVLTFDTARNWTVNGIKSLSLWFQGVAGNGGQLYVKINNTKVSYSGNDGDLARTAWMPWNIDLSKVTGNLSKVTSLTIGIEGAGAKGTVYIDDIRLYPKAPEFITPVPPAKTGLAASYAFDEGTGTVAKDSSGNGNDGTLQGNPAWVDGQSGKALAFSNSRVTLRASNSLGAGLFKAPFTLAAWINAKRTGNTWQQVFRATKADNTSCDTLFLNNDGRLSWRSRVATVWGTMCETAAGVVPANQWTHVVVTGDGTNFRIYVNGALTQTSAWKTTDGTNANYYVGGDPATAGESYAGMADEVRLYSRVLSPEELLSLAGLTKPVAKPF